MMDAVKKFFQATALTMPSLSFAVGTEDPADGKATLKVSGRSYTQNVEQLGCTEQYEDSPALLLSSGGFGQAPYCLGDSPWLSGTE